MSLDQIESTGVYPNEATQCFEAWVVDAETGKKRLLSTCSMCVSEPHYRWWVHQVWGTLSRPLDVSAA